MNGSARPRLHTRGWLIAALAVHVFLGLVCAYRSVLPAFDFDRYYEIGTAAGRPYVDFQAEHPIATVTVFRVLAGLPGGRAGFGVGLVCLNLLADAVIVATLFRAWGEGAAARYAVMVVPLLDLFFNRVDPWSTAAATVAVAAWQRGRPRTLGVALAAGVAFKLWPLVLVSLVFVPRPDRAADAGSHRRAALATFLATGGLIAAATLMVAGPAGIMQVLTFRGARGWQIEGTVGSVLHLAGGIPRMESGAWRTGIVNRWLSIGMFLAAAPICAWSSWRGARAGWIATGWLAAVTTLLLFSALFSAQYVLWFAPAAAIAWGEGARRSTLLAAAAIALTGVIWPWYGAVIASRTPALLLVVLRNVLLVGVAAGEIARLARAQQSPS